MKWDQKEVIDRSALCFRWLKTRLETLPGENVIPSFSLGSTGHSVQSGLSFQSSDHRGIFKSGQAFSLSERTKFRF